MSLRNSQKVSRKANRTGRDPVRRAAQTAAQTIENSNGVISRWETLENRLMMSINQVDPTNLVFEGEDAQATITDGIANTTWMRLGGAGVQGNNTSPSGGQALVAINQNSDVGVRQTATVEYPLNFTTPGVYRLYIRGKFTGGGDNSFWLPPHKTDGSSPINGDPANPADNGNPFDNHNTNTTRVGNYNWYGSDSGAADASGAPGNSPVLYTVGAAGPTSLKFMIRETSYMIDKVVLSTNQSLSDAELNTIAGIGAQPAGGSVTAHYYNDTYQGTGFAPVAPSTARPFPDETIAVARAGDVIKSVPNVNFDWGTGSPDPGIRSDNFSTAFVGKITAPETGEYSIRGFGDDDTHIFVNGQLVSSDPGGHGIEDPTVQGSTDRGGGAVNITLTAGQTYDFVALQTEGGGGAGIQMKWITPSMTEQLGALAPPIAIPSQYLSPAETAPAAPTGVARTDTLPDGSAAGANRVAVTFTDNSTNELHYELQSSTDGGATWLRRGFLGRIVSNDAGAPATDTIVGGAPLPGTTAQYRLIAWNYAGQSVVDVGSVSTPAATDAPGATGYYFNDPFWNGYGGGAPSRTTAGNDILVGRNTDEFQQVPNVDFDYGTSSPDPAVIRPDNHSTVFQGKIHFDEAGVYTVAGFGDDDTYVFIGNQLASAHPGGHGVPASINDIPLKNPINIPAPGDYDFTVLQAEGGGGSAVHLRWTPPSAAGAEPTAVPDANFVSNQPSTPASPTGVSGTAQGQTQVLLNFTDNSKSELRYAVQRSTTPFTNLQGAAPAGTVESLLPISANNTDPDAANTVTFRDTGLTLNTVYYYRIRAENFASSSPWVSGPAAGVRTLADEPVPAAPTNLTASGLGTRNQLVFDDNSVNETGFIIERKLASAPDSAFAPIAASPVPGSAQGATGSFTYNDTGVDENVLYSYRVRAKNIENEESANSNTATANQVGLKATIWDTYTFTDDPANPNDPVVRIDPFIDFDFDAQGGGSPVPGVIGVDTFSIRWEGLFNPQVTGDYVIHGISDDGIQIFIDGNSILPANSWNDRGRTDSPSDPIHFDAGSKHIFVVNYRENGGGANVTVDAEIDGANRHVLGGAEYSRENLPLVAPTTVTAVNPMNDCVTVRWNDSNNVETGYEVQRSTAADFSANVVQVGTTGPNVSQLVDLTGTTLSGTEYFYRVRTLGAPAPTAYSAASEGVTPGPAPSTADINVTSFADPATQALFQLNGSAAFRDADADPDATTERLMLTDNVNSQAGTAFFTDSRSVKAFKAEFDFQVTESNGADGLAFVLQANDPTALGGGGGALGYGGIPNSFAVIYDFYPNPGTNQTGFLFNGGIPTDTAGPATTNVTDPAFEFDAGAGANADGTTSGNVLHSTIAYDYATKKLTVTIDDINNPATAPFSVTYDNVDIPNSMGSACAFVGFSGGTGGLNSRQEVANFKFTNVAAPPPTPARVTQVFVNGQGVTGQTTANGIAFRNLAGVDNTFGYPVPGPNELKSIPWSNGINKISLRFDSDVASTLGQDDLVVRGINTANYAVSGFSYDPATKTGTWTLTSPIVNDKVNLFVDDAGVGGLDGEWTTAQAYPSGNGTAGGDFTFRLNVLRGDANQDGAVNALDLGQLKSKLNRTATNPGTGTSAYSVFADLNADGQINALDLGIAKARLNNRLPAGEPASLFSSLPISR